MHINEDDVTGQSNRYIECWQMDNQLLLHAKVISPLTHLQQAAATAGFDLQVVSGYRSFDDQLLLWNDKFQGRRKVLNDEGEAVDMQALSPLARIQAVMRWTALPGASRHHWGTDFDIYDKAAISSNYRFKLTPDEYTGSGPFAPMMLWLTQYLAEQTNVGFCQPYTVDRKGIAPEPWHISYQPVACYYQRALCLRMVRECIENSQCAEKMTVIKYLLFLFNRYIQSPKN